MATILDTIVETKRREVKKLYSTGATFGPRTSAARPFVRALESAPAMGIIAEVKKASPSRGIICSDFDPVRIALGYQRAGAHAISVLTDEQYFMGSLDYLSQVREAVTLPVLRKEFIIDPIQIAQSAHYNADAVLLIAAILSDTQLAELHTAACVAGVEPLIEVHDAHELERALRVNPQVIGINNRDLRTFTTRIETTLELMSAVAPGVCVVSESGIATGAQARLLLAAGVGAVLVGESLVKLDSPDTLLKELSCAGSH